MPPTHTPSPHSFPYALALLSCVSDSTLHAAAGMLEWMSDELLRDFNRDFSNPMKHDAKSLDADGGRSKAGAKGR